MPSVSFILGGISVKGVTNAKNDPHCGVQKGPDHP